MSISKKNTKAKIARYQLRSTQGKKGIVVFLCVLAKTELERETRNRQAAGSPPSQRWRKSTNAFMACYRRLAKGTRCERPANKNPRRPTNQEPDEKTTTKTQHTLHRRDGHYKSRENRAQLHALLICLKRRQWKRKRDRETAGDRETARWSSLEKQRTNVSPLPPATSCGRTISHLPILSQRRSKQDTAKSVSGWSWKRPANQPASTSSLPRISLDTAPWKGGGDSKMPTEASDFLTIAQESTERKGREKTEKDFVHRNEEAVAPRVGLKVELVGKATS